MSAASRVILKPREEERILSGHPWIYDNEIESTEGSPEPGAIVDVESSRKRYIGRGYWNPASKIRVRLLSRSKDGVDTGFWKKKIKKALEYRSALFDLERDSFRLLFGEADGTPGLVVDLYRDRSAAALPAGPAPGAIGPRIAVAQFLSLGVDARRAEITRAIREAVAPDFLIERSDAPVRALEGLAGDVVSADPGAPDGIVIEEEGIFLRARLLSGQKTGSFLDQRLNRAAAARYAKGRRVLDAFCNSGGFGIQALKAGAASVDFVDSQEEALSAVSENLALNGFGSAAEGESPRARVIRANAFDFLKEAERRKERYGLVILDPPAFAKSRDQVEGAWRGYKDINMRALSLLEEGGWLVTCSCSQHFGPDRFLAMLTEAARDAGRRLRIAETRYQAPDHPVLAGYPESLYLKCLIACAD